jgi:hypothetical protein
MTRATFRLGELAAIIGDNSAAGGHRAGYNGLWSLKHRSEPTDLFVPAVTGLNFERFFDIALRSQVGSKERQREQHIFTIQ